MKEQVRPRDVLPAKAKGPRKARLRSLLTGLKDHAQRNQAPLRKELDRLKSLGRVERARPLWIFNGLAVTASEDVIRALAARDDVLEVRPDRQIPPPPRPSDAGAASGTTEWNIAKIRAPEAWALAPGYDGTGAVIGSFDTGVDLSHPDLFSRYRGDDSISWFDPYGEHAFPFDPNGHGTHTTATAVGGDASGSQIGVAPGAKWIAAKAWDDRGYGYASDFHRIFEWFLAPGGNPDNAPDVVNNSWAFIAAGCDDEFAADIQALRAAEIFPAVAAGNAGPGIGSVRAPGGYPESFTVGASDAFDEIASFSGRGPSPCGGLTKPDISAPGVGVYSAIPGGYATYNGTSMATPHITGAVAVLRSIRPEWSVDELGAALTLGAQDIAGPGSDNDAGEGRLDLLVSAQIAINGLDRPVVKVLSTVATISEAGPTPGQFTVSRTGSTDAPLQVMLSTTGTATAGVDYVTLPTSVTIPAGSKSATVAVVPIDDAFPENNETVSLEILPDPAYIPSSARLASVIIVSDELFSDLIVNALTIPPYVGAGESFTITETTRNQGQGNAQASVTRFFLSSDTTLDSADTELGARNVPALAPGDGNTASTQLTIPAGTPTATWYVIAQADGTQLVEESIEANNLAVRVVQIGADMIVTTMTAPATSGAGQSFTVTDTTKNQGAGPAPASVTHYVLSANTMVDAGDTVVGSRSVPALAPGASSTGSAVVTIPGTVAVGTWYLLAQADADGAVVETIEGNNLLVRAVRMGPDLFVTGFSAPATAGPGETLTLTETTKNQGGSLAGASVTQYYLSANTVFDGTPTDILLGERSVPGLAPDAGDDGTVAVTLPPGLPAGVWYLIARADAGGAIEESMESNNFAFRSIQLGADMSVSLLSAPSSAAAGQSVTVSDTTRNQGGAQAVASMTRFYLSANTVLDSGDLAIGARAVPPLAAGASSSGSTAIAIPVDWPTGTWYLIAKADDDDNVVETSELNNTLLRSIQIGPDLIVSSVTAPATVAAGASVSVSDTTKNQGAAPTAASTTQYYLSSNSILDPAEDQLLASRAVPALAPGASSSGSVNVTIPAGLSSGTWYLIVQADSLGVVAETVEYNNTSLRSVQIGADLVVLSFTAPSTAASGQNISVTDTTKNQGAATAGASVTAYYLSTDAVVDAGDQQLGTRAVPPLSSGASSTGSTTLRIPDGLAPGTWYLIALSDAEDAVTETNEANNRVLRSVQIGADLTVSPLSAPSTAGPGQNLTITETTRNVGGEPAAASTTAYYLSSNTTLDTNEDRFLGNRSVPALAPGATSSGSTVVLLPADTPAGIWYVIAKADMDETVIETNEANNVALRSVQVGPDMVITYLSVPSSVTAGGTLTVTDTLRNQGAVEAGASVTRYFLSRNTTLDASDDAVGERAVTVLTAGASNSASTVLTIPAGTATGTWYLLVKLDADDSVPESNEGNNIGIRVLQVSAP